MIIGVTGGIGSGKSLAAAVLADKGFRVIDADKTGHAVLAKGGAAYAEVLAEFGADYLLENGEFDRRRLGAQVFADKAALSRLNALTHPAICREIERGLSAGGDVALDCALLIETGLYKLCHAVWLITAPEETRVRRIMARSGLSEREARSRIAAQTSDEYKQAFADAVLKNDGSVENFKERVLAALAGLKEK